MANQGALLPSTNFQPPGMVDLSAGASATARALEIGVNSTTTVAQTLNNHLAERAQITGKLAGAKDGSRIDPATGELMPLDLPAADSISIQDQAYRIAALQTYSNVATNQAQNYANELSERYKAQPDQLTNAWNNYTHDTLSKVQPEALGLIQPDLINIGNSMISKGKVEAEVLLRNDHAQALDNRNVIMRNHVQQDLDGIAQGNGKDLNIFQIGANQQKATETINTYMQDWDNQMAVASAANPNVFLPETVAKMRNEELKTLWAGYVKSQAKQFANQEVVVGGKLEANEDGKNRYMAEVPNLVPKGLFSSDELTKLDSEAGTAFTQQAGSNAQKRINDASTAEAGYTGSFNQDKTSLDKALVDAKVSLDFTDFDAQVHALDTQNKTYGLDTNASQKRKDELIQGAWQAKNAFQEQMRTQNIQGMLNSANSSTVNHTNPYTLPDGQGAKTVLEHQQFMYDKQNPNGMMHISDDPTVFSSQMFDDSNGFVWHGGKLPPRIGSEFSNFIPSQNVQANANALANYDRIMKDPYAAGVLMRDYPDVSARMERWRAAQGTGDKALQTFALLTGSTKENQTFMAGNQQAAVTIGQGYEKDPKLVAQDIGAAVTEGVGNSNSVSALFRDFVGLPPLTSGMAVTKNFRPGVAGLILSDLPDSVLRGLGLAIGGDMNIIYDDQTGKAFVAAKVAAAANGVEANSQNGAAFGQLANDDIHISRLLYAPQLVTATNDAAGLKASFVLGKYAPEAYYGLPSNAIAADISIKGMGWWDKMAPHDAVSEGWYHRQLQPPGSPFFLQGQFEMGNLRLSPVGVVKGKMQYDVILRAQTDQGDRWVHLNPPGEYYSYDAATHGDVDAVQKGATAGGNTARKVGDTLSPYFGEAIGRVVGQGAGSYAAWNVETQEKAKQQDAAQAKWTAEHGLQPVTATTRNLPEK